MQRVALLPNGNFPDLPRKVLRRMILILNESPATARCLYLLELLDIPVHLILTLPQLIGTFLQDPNMKVPPQRENLMI